MCPWTGELCPQPHPNPSLRAEAGALGASFHGHASEPRETCPNLTTSRNHWKAALGGVHSASQHVLCCSPFVTVQKVKQELRKGSESADCCPLHGPQTPAPAQGLVLSAARLQSPTEMLQLLTTWHQWNEYHQLGRGCGGVSTAKGGAQTAWQGCPASSSPPKFQTVQPGQAGGHPAHLLEGPGCQSSVHRDPGAFVQGSGGPDRVLRTPPPPQTSHKKHSPANPTLPSPRSIQPVTCPWERSSTHVPAGGVSKAPRPQHTHRDEACVISVAI